MFNTLIILYLFLGGFGAGTFVLTIILGWLPLSWFGLHNPSHDQHLRNLHEKVGFLSALTALGVGIVALCLDLGSRAFKFYFALNNLGSSWLSNGALSLALLALLGLVLILHKEGFFSLPTPLLMAAKILGLFTALFVMFYTGAFLYSMGNAIPLWGTPMLPLLFCLSSLSCGLAVHGLIAAYYKTPGQCGIERFLSRSEVVVLALELIVAGVFAWLAYGSQFFPPPLPASSPLGTQLAILFNGKLPQFYYAYLLIGIVIPLLISIVAWTRTEPFDVSQGRHAGNVSRKLKAFAMTCIIVGAFCLRFAVVTDASHPSFYSSQEKVAAQTANESSLEYPETINSEMLIEDNTASSPLDNRGNRDSEDNEDSPNNQSYHDRKGV